MYDAIIVGARCAGSPTAMLLARRGRRILLLERASFASDTLSTHYIHQSGVARLARWGLADRLAETGCPPIRRYRFDVGPFALTGSPPPLDGVDAAYSPRRPQRRDRRGAPDRRRARDRRARPHRRRACAARAGPRRDRRGRAQL